MPSWLAEVLLARLSLRDLEVPHPLRSQSGLSVQQLAFLYFQVPSFCLVGRASLQGNHVFSAFHQQHAHVLKPLVQAFQTPEAAVQVDFVRLLTAHFVE